jgi:regulation of enolase protein 1 (concanavalin A-like superfamily)
MAESALRQVQVCVTRILFVTFVVALVLSPVAARAQVPSPWTNDDVGAVGMAGSASPTTSGITVRGSGADVWGTADGFHFVYRTLSGDGQIIARIGSLTRAHASTKAGVMMRDGVGPGDPNAFALLTPDGAVRFQHRTSPGGTTATSYSSTAAIPEWIRLVRAGNTFRAYFSPDGSAWTAGGSASIVMGGTIEVGLAVTSHNQLSLATAVFSNIWVTSTHGNLPPVVTITSPASSAQFDEPATITLSASASDSGGAIQQVQFFNGSTVLATDTASPYSTTITGVAAGTYTLKAVALDYHGASASSSVTVTVRPGSSPWDNEDVGTVSIAGSATFTWNGATVRGAGANIWGTADGFHFAYRTLTGDGQIVARLDSQQRTDPWAKAGVMMRETLSAISSHASAFQTLDYGPVFERRAVPGGTSSRTSGSGGAAPRWLKIARKGSTFTASESATGTTWAVIGSQTITMQSTIYVGLAVTSHNAGALSTATFSNVSVVGTTTSLLTNQAPAVSLTSPASGASFTAPATVSIAANARDADGSVTQVQFFSGSTLLATDTTSPYGYSWTGVAAGSYSLTAVARDNEGATRRSAAVSITIGSGNQPPTVSITTPVSGASFAAPASISIAATASDPGGSVAQVQFFAGSTLLATDTTSPYSYSWNNVAAGSYSLTVVARDNLGATRRSAAVSITVRSATLPPTRAVFGPSPDHSVVTYYLLEIYLAGQTPGSVTPTRSLNMGKPAVVNNQISVDIATLISGLAPGNYIATVSAVNAAGRGRSAPTSFVK